MSWLDAILLGLVEGITEFLPISSTGHLILTRSLLGLNGPEATRALIVIQGAAILAVCWEYRVKLWNVALLPVLGCECASLRAEPDHRLHSARRDRADLQG